MDIKIPNEKKCVLCNKRFIYRPIMVLDKNDKVDFICYNHQGKEIMDYINAVN